MKTHCAKLKTEQIDDPVISQPDYVSYRERCYKAKVTGSCPAATCFSYYQGHLFTLKETKNFLGTKQIAKPASLIGGLG